MNTSVSVITPEHSNNTRFSQSDSSVNGAQAAAVSCREVRKTFGQGDAAIEVLRGVDFEARQGKLTFLVGPSGCGKTTLISVIAGLLDRSAGRVELFGQDVQALT